MSRISLVEAYDNRDVIGQLVRLREDVNELQNILKDIDPDGDLTNVVTKTGDQVIDGIKTFVGKIVADCDIIQLGGNYETHAEQVYSKNDYIVMRDEAVSGLAPGTYSGFQVKKYNGVDDARLVVDNEGVARVGDLNDEQPLLTRDEVADMTNGAIVTWDGTYKKAVAAASNIGSDTKPVKIVNGQAVAVTNDLAVNSQVVHDSGNETISGQKTFSSPLRTTAAGVQFGQLYAGKSGTKNEVIVEVRNSDEDFAKIILQFDEGTNEGKILLQKRVSGALTTSTIATV